MESPSKGGAEFPFYADMAELADALGSGPSDRKVVEVRVLLSAPQTVAGGRYLMPRWYRDLTGRRVLSHRRHGFATRLRARIVIETGNRRPGTGNRFYAPADNRCVLRLCAMPYCRIL